MTDKKVYEYNIKSVMIGRKPRVNTNDEYKMLSLAFFNENNPHKTEGFPVEELDFPNTEKIRIIELNSSYYLEGNDIIINDLKKIKIEVEGTKVFITGEQDLIERR